MSLDFALLPFLTFVVSDVEVELPDEKSIMTYVSTLYDALPDRPAAEKVRIGLGSWILDNDTVLVRSRYERLSIGRSRISSLGPSKYQDDARSIVACPRCGAQGQFG